MNKERLEKALKEKGAVSVKINLGFTQNDPSDPEGHRLPPIVYPAVIEADGLTQEQIDAAVAEVEADDAMKNEQKEDDFADRILKALERLKTKGKLEKILRAKDDRV
jgi:hypothetical protein